MFTNQKTHEVVSFDIFTTFGDFTREIFSGPSGFYKIQFNLKNEQPKIFVSGKIFILNKEGHKNRNFYNRVAKGKLVRCNGDTFMDENGCKWELVSYMGSLYHDPSNNVKFLHKTSGVGEYETIRTLIGKETRNSDVFEGPNLITGIYAGSYNFGKTYGVDYKSLSHQFLDMAPHNDEWGKIYKDFGEVFLSACKTSLNSISTLFLMDISGSMSENNKYNQAIEATLNTILTIKQEAQQSCLSPEIGIMAFSGDCVPNPTTLIQPFSTDLDEIQTSINHIPFPNGNTPSPQAIESAKRALEKQLSQKGQTCGSLIIMTDGQSSCGTVIPPNAYSGKREIKICGQQNGSTAFNITLFAVGFDVPPGSVAERELQYLANTSGGKYFNAQDQYQLTRSFQKINRIYTPIANPQTKMVDAGLNGMFNSGYIYVTSTQQYDTALVLYRRFITAYPADSSGQYNYALMCEANERYKTAVKYYEIYLQHALNDPNRQFLLERIATLRKDYDIQLAYNKQVIQSDLAYLKQHFEQLRTTPNAVPLAGEFGGFIQEKQTFYKALPDILEMEDGWLKQYAKEIAQALKEASYFLSKKPGQWDLNGVSIIGNVYEPLDRLAKKLGK